MSYNSQNYCSIYFIVLFICRIGKFVGLNSMHAYIIAGGAKSQRQARVDLELKTWHSSPFDRISLQPEGLSIGIAQVRLFQKNLMLAPIHSNYTVGVIFEADRLTLEAQQALLKTLEEPPPRAKIILETYSTATLLPTISSRCQIISLRVASDYDSETLLQCSKTLEQIRRSAIGERLKLIEGVAKTREEAVAWVDLAITTTREAMLSSFGISRLRQFNPTSSQPTPGPISTTGLLRRLLKAQAELSANVNPKLVLDNIFID